MMGTNMPLAIPPGTSIQHLLGEHAVARLARHILRVYPGFDADAFSRQALQGLEPLGLMERARHVARALRAYLPPLPGGAEVLLASMPPPHMRASDGSELFFYLPHACFVAEYGQSAQGEA